MKDDSFNILIAGVGGQGNLLLGNVIAEAAAKLGYRPVIGQIFGASRRGGSVFTHVRLAHRDLGPLIPTGHVNLLIGLEPLEALRAAVSYNGADTEVVVSEVQVPTAGSLGGIDSYPNNVVDTIRTISKRVYIASPSDALKKAGSPRALNFYLMGTAIGFNIDGMPLTSEAIIERIKALSTTDESNLKALEFGILDAEGRN